MVLSIKRQIVSQLKTFNKHFNYNSIKTKPINGVNKKPTLLIDLNDLIDSEIKQNDVENHVSNTIKSKNCFIGRVFTEINDENRAQLMIEIDENYFFKQLINEMRSNLIESNGCLINNILSERKPETIVVEYSSPNMAKPFHVGNLRSTIIGNFVANMNQFCGNNVIRLNYLGDWGTQFGILSLAYDYFGDDRKLVENPLKHLLDVYVKGNKECSDNEEWRQSAKSRFNLLETKQDSDVFNQWLKFRELSINELKTLYSRIGIYFDEFHSESMYSKASLEVIKQLKDMNITETNDENDAIFAVIKSSEKSEKIPVIKSDGSTLYLTRDIAAAIHRKDIYGFNRMYYIVDSSQSKHFTNLKNILKEAKYDWYQQITHLRFGRITGMSTRRGEIVFLEDVLNEAKEMAFEAFKSSPNIKINEEDFDKIADILGTSAVLIHDMSHRRVEEYKFNWNSALRLNGNTGISLQYTHARLCNLELNCGFEFDPNSELNLETINCYEGILLLSVLSEFNDVLIETHEKLEPNILVNYLFKLRKAINKDYKVLTIKGVDAESAQSRLLLFNCARNVLCQGMKLLGLNPLKSM